MADQRYRVVDRLESGGMAEVFRGEALSVQGFKKQVAIKRVLPHLAQNDGFIAMFLDEARLGARLSHANIVTVFDIGAADNTYFIVMEFIDGANLKSISEGLRKQGRRCPMKEAIYICIEACRGLSYAHEAVDDDGDLLHIVHRDVSPPNILISKRGEVKVTDFGLAKATTQLESTDPGVVKGKFSYLAPEAAMGQPVDARADIFAMGIVLWEMLAGRRLFLGETDYQTVKLVQQANIPSLRRLNPEVDEEFEKVLSKALARDPADRYESARDFGDALAGYIFSHQMKVTAYDIANLVKSAVAKNAAPAQEQSIIDRLIQEELLSFTSLDEMGHAPGTQPLTHVDVPASRPSDRLSFENPADWFSDDDVAGALGEGRADSGRSGWRESGANVAPAQSEDTTSKYEALPAPSSVPPPAPAPKAPADAAPTPKATPQVVAQAPARAAPKPAPAPEAKGGGLGVVLLVVAVIAGGVAAAWFGGLIPH